MKSRFGFSAGLWSLLLLVALLGAGCRGHLVQQVVKSEPLMADAGWGLLPMMNYSETPEAGLRVEEMIATLLRGRGLKTLQSYPKEAAADELLDLNQWPRLNQARQWAEREGLRYAVSGSLQEWHYKTGLEAEPVVGVTLEVTDLQSQQVVWSASGSLVGAGRDSLSGVGQQLLQKLLAKLPLHSAGKS